MCSSAARASAPLRCIASDHRIATEPRAPLRPIIMPRARVRRRRRRRQCSEISRNLIAAQLAKHLQRAITRVGARRIRADGPRLLLSARLHCARLRK